MPYSKPDKAIAQRIASKKASRKKDRVFVQAGGNLDELQRKNSILPDDFFNSRKISNFAEAVGR
jgi:hypothetical protein